MRWLLLSVLALFAVLGALRMNPFCLFEPDTPEYLFTSRALAEMRGYVEIDHVGEPPHTFRPPGLPLLLAPYSLVRPYDVVGGKVVLLIVSLGLLALVWVLTRALAGPWAAAIALLLVATSPYTLLHATEVVSEIPFVAGSLLLLWMVTRPREGSPSWKEVGAASALLAFLPLLRMVGIALAGALALWALLRPQRRRWLISAGACIAAFLLWAWRCSAAGGPTYFGAIQNKLASGGAGALAAMASESLRFYLDRFSQVLLPGVFAGQPIYERFLPDGARSLNGLFGLGLVMALACVALAVHGAVKKRSAGGDLALLYVVLTFLILAIYPPRHERLVWPLIPLVWIFAAAGGPERKPWPRRVAAGIALVLAGWQLVSSLDVVRTNLQWREEGDRFYARVPPMYFVDWQRAGQWIAAHAPPGARVLTRHSDVGFTARRYQEGIRFEETSPADWRRRVAQVPARYLVVPKTLFGRLFPAEAQRGDPVYTLVPVYDAADAQVLEVRPNRTGTVSAEPAVSEEDVAACRSAAQRFPGRSDLRVRLAEMLGERGRVPEALTVLRGAGAPTARDRLALGEMLLRAGAPAEARAAFQAAAALPEADLLARRIRRGLTRAEEAMASAGRESIDSLLARARFSLEVLRVGDALADVERARSLAPAHPEVLQLHGELLQRLGRLEEARGAFEAALRAGHPDAARKLRLLQLLRLPPSLELAQALVEDGTPGQALDVLERAGGAPENRALLAELYLFYGEAERAAPLFRELGSARGLAACEELLRAPSSL